MNKFQINYIITAHYFAICSCTQRNFIINFVIITALTSLYRSFSFLPKRISSLMERSCNIHPCLLNKSCIFLSFKSLATKSKLWLKLSMYKTLSRVISGLRTTSPISLTYFTLPSGNPTFILPFRIFLLLKSSLLSYGRWLLNQ